MPMLTSVQRSVMDEMIKDSIAEGWNLKSQKNGVALLTKGSKPDHVIHAGMSLITAGIWLPVWGYKSLIDKEKRRMINVDEDGSLSVTDL